MTTEDTYDALLKACDEVDKCLDPIRVNYLKAYLDDDEGAMRLLEEFIGQLEDTLKQHREDREKFNKAMQEAKDGQ